MTRLTRTPVPGDVAHLRDFYAPEQGEPNLFQVWEKGGARGDSVTPSVYSVPYREWMRGKLVAALRGHGPSALLALGSGNAVVESEIASEGYRVLAVDALPEAVDMARSKGLDAVCADVMTWAPDGVWPVIYADGLFGHLHGIDGGLASLFARLRGWLTIEGGGGTLIVSNDSPQNGDAVQEAPGVPGFCWLSGPYLREQALVGGFCDVSVEAFCYERPLSGKRTRAVVTAAV